MSISSVSSNCIGGPDLKHHMEQEYMIVYWKKDKDGKVDSKNPAEFYNNEKYKDADVAKGRVDQLNASKEGRDSVFHYRKAIPRS